MDKYLEMLLSEIEAVDRLDASMNNRGTYEAECVVSSRRNLVWSKISGLAKAIRACHKPT